MALPDAVLAYLNENSRAAGSEAPGTSDDLFKLGALDSFALVEFLTILEDNCGIKVPDSDVNAVNFQTIEKIEQYVQGRNEA